MELTRLDSIEERSYDDEKWYIFKWFLIAFALRIVMVGFIYLFEEYLGAQLYIDDLKYETYAKMYSTMASRVLDLEAFRMTDKGMGGIGVAHLYFRLNAVLYYLFNSVLVLRLANIFFSSLTVVPMYLISKELFGSKEARIATIIFAVLPYHVMMSSFLFKDILIILLMASSLYIILKYYRTGRLNILFFLLVTIPIEWLRNGTPLFLIGVLGMAIFFRFYKKNKLNKIISLTILPILFFIVAKLVLIDNIGLVLTRLNNYMGYQRQHMGNINLIRIDSVRQLYKLPLTWLFSTFNPLSLGLNINSWSKIMGLLNYSLIFIAFAYVMYTLFTKKSLKEKIFFYPMLVLHLLVIMAVINVPRHYYFLHFYIIICASAYMARLEGTEKRIFILLSSIATVLLLFVSLMLT